MQQITVKELYENWNINNPHYGFSCSRARVHKIEKIAKTRYRLIGDRFAWTVNEDWIIEVHPKFASDLDATLPIIPAETAQRDHDRIVQLEAENAKLREFVESLTDPAIGGYYGENLINFAKLFLERLGQ